MDSWGTPINRLVAAEQNSISQLLYAS